MKNVIITVIMAILAPSFGVLCAVSTNRWFDVVERAPEEYRNLKMDLLREAGLFDLHHKVYAQVGERDWETRVKPGFLSAITWRTARDSGNWIPSSQDIILWVREHPAEARGIMETLGNAKHTD